MNQDLERIYGVSTSDPNVGRWFANKDTKDSFVRYFEDYREIVHKRSYLDQEGWVISVGGPGNSFQVGENFFTNAKVAKFKADNRSGDELFYLEMQVDKMREANQPVKVKEPEIDYGF